MIENPLLAADQRPRSRPGQNTAQPVRSSAAPTILLGLFGATCLLSIAVTAAGTGETAPWRWVETVLPILAALTALASLTYRLALQNLLTIGGIIWLFSAAIVGCASVSGIPFGPIAFSANRETLLLGKLPLSVPFYWVAILASSRETARLALSPWRRSRSYGFGIVALAAVLAVVADLNWEPFAVHIAGGRTWHTPERAVCWYSAPWYNFIAWAVSTAVILAFCTPWFLSKRPVGTAPRLRPALVWGTLNVYFVLGNALRGLWLAVAVGGALVATGLWTAWQAARPASEPATPVPTPAPPETCERRD